MTGKQSCLSNQRKKKLSLKISGLSGGREETDSKKKSIGDNQDGGIGYGHF